MGPTGTLHLAWYVGDGAGARARLAAVRPHLAAARVTALTVGPAPDLEGAGLDVLELPWAPTLLPVRGADGGDAAVGATGLDRATAARVASWCTLDRPDLLVVDDRPALARHVRRLGVPCVPIGRFGNADDELDLDEVAPVSGGVLAAYPSSLEADGTPRDVRERTVHVGLLSRYAGRRPHRRAGRRALGLPADGRVVTVVCGRDGLAGAGDLAAAAAASPGWTWVTVGRCGTRADGAPTNLHRLGWSDDPWPALEAADVVVASAALSVVAEVASARRPLLLVPRPERGDERTAQALAAVGAATPLRRWPEPFAWPEVLADAAAVDPRPLGRLEDARAPARTADWLLSWARTVPSVPAPAGGATAADVLDLRSAPLPVSGGR